MWDKYGKCPCGFHTVAPFGNLFHIHMKVCPECGEDKYSWDVVTARPIWLGKFYLPWTWLNTGWEEKEASC